MRITKDDKGIYKFYPENGIDKEILNKLISGEFDGRNIIKPFDGKTTFDGVKDTIKLTDIREGDIK